MLDLDRVKSYIELGFEKEDAIIADRIELIGGKKDEYI